MRMTGCALKFHFTIGKSLCGMKLPTLQPHFVTFGIQLSLTLADLYLQFPSHWSSICHQLLCIVPYRKNKQVNYEAI